MYMKKLDFFIDKKYLVEKFASKFEILSFNESFQEISFRDLYKNLDNEIYNSLIFTKIESHNSFFYELIPFLKKALLNITNSSAIKNILTKIMKKIILI